jgi:hypothetical protein
MVMKLEGTVNGRHIELDHEVPLAAGSRVSVQIKAQDLSVAEKRRVLHELCGVWKDDLEIQAIFREIEQQRKLRKPREVNLDVAP